MRILIVEDEERMAKTIQSILERQTYISDIAADGEAALNSIFTGIYDMVILDVMLPKRDGFQVVETMRARGINTPVLMLTAKTSVADRIAGLDKGADYYLTKPFSTGELLACIRALLRRPKEVNNSVLTYGDVLLDTESGGLFCGERNILLNKRELELMRILMRSAGSPIPRESLLIKVWGTDTSPESNVVDAYMSFLRKKLAFIQSQVSILNVRRIGYYLSVQGDGA